MENYSMTNSIPPTPDPTIGVPGPWREDNLSSTMPSIPQIYQEGSKEQETLTQMLHAWYQW